MENLARLSFLVLALTQQSVAQLPGFDGIDPISTSAMECLHRSYNNFIGRIQNGDGSYDTIGAQNLKNAISGISSMSRCLLRVQ